MTLTGRHALLAACRWAASLEARTVYKFGRSANNRGPRADSVRIGIVRLCSSRKRCGAHGAVLALAAVIPPAATTGRPREVRYSCHGLSCADDGESSVGQRAPRSLCGPPSAVATAAGTSTRTHAHCRLTLRSRPSSVRTCSSAAVAQATTPEMPTFCGSNEASTATLAPASSSAGRRFATSCGCAPARSAVA